MPEYTFPLANGKELVLEGDREPTKEEVLQAAGEAGVTSLLQRDTPKTPEATVWRNPDDPASVPSVPPGARLDPGGLAVAALGAAVPFAGPALRTAGSILTNPATDAVLGGIAGYKTGGVPGAMLGAGAGLAAGKMGKAAEAFIGAQKAQKAATIAKMQAKQPAALRRVLLPQEIAEQTAEQDFLKLVASQQGRRAAGLGKKGFIRSK